MARKISMIDLAGIGNLLEYLVAADNITCEERDRIILRIAKENDYPGISESLHYSVTSILYIFGFYLIV